MRRPSLILAPLVLIFALDLQAQSIGSGTWEGLMYSPNLQPHHATFDVTDDGKDLRIHMTVSVDNWSRSWDLQNIRFTTDRLYFFWPELDSNCIVQREDHGHYQGACVDPFGHLGPVLLAPPGVRLDESVLDVEEAYNVWLIEEHRMNFDRDKAPAGSRVDIGGRHLNAYESGEGEYTVVLEAGLGESLESWELVQLHVQEFARVISYDRAGQGFSDPGAHPADPEQASEDLRKLLERTSTSGPVILVGHGLGTIFTRKYAALFPEQVAGLVLIEPVHERQGLRWKEISAASWKEYWGRISTLYSMAPGPLKAEFEMYELMMARGEFPGEGTLPDVPTVVITSQRPVEDPKWIGETEEGRQARHELLEALVSANANATHIITRSSGSFVHLEEPYLVARIIREVIEAAREK